MQFDFRPDQPEDDDACLAATGRTYDQWFEAIESAGLASKRRDAIQMIYDATGRGKDVWWPTTIWVAFDRARGIVQKDGRPDGYHICCTKGLKAEPAAVFAHFADDASLNAWLHDWVGPVVEGAPFSCGTCSGTVGRIREGKDIRMAWQSPGFGPTDVEIQFPFAGGKTTVTVNHKRIATRAEADGLRRAWNEALERLKAKVG